MRVLHEGKNIICCKKERTKSEEYKIEDEDYKIDNEEYKINSEEGIEVNCIND